MKIYTDGSARGNGYENSRGGWAFITEEGDACYGLELNTTNNRMELTAAIKALEFAETARLPEEIVTIITDSAYLCNCWKEGWWKSWTKNGWKNSKKQPVSNQDLWELIIPYFENSVYVFEKVKGHNGHEFNEKADFYATMAADGKI